MYHEPLVLLGEITMITPILSLEVALVGDLSCASSCRGFSQELLRDQTLCKHRDGGCAGNALLATVSARGMQYRPVALERKA